MLAQNLVPNPSFEIQTDCPTTVSMVALAPPWYYPTLGTADYFYDCPYYPGGWVDVPQNMMGYQYANSGNGYMGLINYNYYREYISAPLSNPLEFGKSYEIAFYISLAENSPETTYGFGALLSVDSPECPNSPWTLLDCYSPQIVEGTYITDEINWQLISGCIEASGNENHITIGNFESSTTFIPTDNLQGNKPYFYIDDVSVRFPFKSSLGPDTTICKGQGLLLDASIMLNDPVGVPSYEWQNGSTDSVFLVRTEGLYWVEILLGTGCSIRDSIYVNIGDSLIFSLGDDVQLCHGENLLLKAPNVDADFEWQDGSTDSIFQVSEAGIYSLSIYGEDYCNTTDTIEVKYFQSDLSLDLLQDTTILFCEGETFLIELPEGDIEYTWFNGLNSNSMLIESPGIFWLTMQDSCRYLSDTIVVTGCPTSIDIPNIFSPNSDGLNDVFYPALVSNMAELNIQIYNRWGQKIFESDDFTGWDGTFQGEECPNENYIWIIEALDYQGERINLKGGIVLIR